MTLVIHSNTPRSGSAQKRFERRDTDGYPHYSGQQSRDDIARIVLAEVQAAERHHEAP